MRILVTGAAGFIGSALAYRLAERGDEVVGIDNINDYYDIRLKFGRLQECGISSDDGFSDGERHSSSVYPNYSITNPYAYLDSNLVGFMNILECCRNYSVVYLVDASSSSVYGMCDKVPFRESDQVDNPVSLYAATKKSNELMAHAYSKLYGIPVTGLRYGCTWETM